MIRVLGIDIPQGWAVVDVPLIGQAHGVAFGELEKGREAARFAELVANTDRRALESRRPWRRMCTAEGQKAMKDNGVPSSRHWLIVHDLPDASKIVR
jgi:hypothetical protein